MIRKTPIKTAILVSGRGSNMKAVIKASQVGTLKDKINPVIVISDKLGIRALEIAKELGVSTICINFEEYKNKYKQEEAITLILKQHNVEFIILAGYMRLLQNCVLQTFPNKIINIHPSLLPAFPGINAQKQAMQYGVKIIGCTVHFVDAGIDTGKIIAQESCVIYANDTVESLSKRLLPIEHELLVNSLRNLFIGGYFDRTS